MTRLDIHSPLQAAVDQMAAKTAVGSPMLSREWELLPAELKLRTMFSARVERERTVAEMQARITDTLAGRKREGVTMDKGRFVEEMREIVRSTGYKRPDGTHRKSIQNLKSRARLELIWDMNMAQARGYAGWLADMTPEGLENEPCYELVRVITRSEVRDWPLVWSQAGGEFYGGPGSNKFYPLAPGRMIAKKTDPIWTRISRFGTPWPPFDWGSGMGLAGIDITEAEDLGVVSPDDEPQEPLAKPFNEDYSASAKGLPQDRVDAILADFAGDVELQDGRFRIIPPKAKDSMSVGKRPVEPQEPVERTASTISPPHGKPLESLMRIQAGGIMRQIFEQAAGIASKAHGGGNLVPLEARTGRPFFSRPNGFGDYRKITDRKESPIMWVEDSRLPEGDGGATLKAEDDIMGFRLLAALHEIGHWVDNTGLHDPDPIHIYASETRLETVPLMTLVATSTAATRLRALWPNDESGMISELFSRAYAQYVAETAGHRLAKGFIRKLAAGDFERAGLPRYLQWNPAQFHVIRKEFDRLFAQASWKGGAR